jgi:hypothetical protein
MEVNGYLCLHVYLSIVAFLLLLCSSHILDWGFCSTLPLSSTLCKTCWSISICPLFLPVGHCVCVSIFLSFRKETRSYVHRVVSFSYIPLRNLMQGGNEAINLASPINCCRCFSVYPESWIIKQKAGRNALWEHFRNRNWPHPVSERKLKPRETRIRCQLYNNLFE